MQELNVPILKDSMGGNATGAYWFLLSLNPKDESRSTSQGFYTPSRENLHLLIRNQVTKLLLDTSGTKPKVRGVEYTAGETAERYHAMAGREVILAAGALHTPQLLELSGIGDSRILSGLDIPTVVHLPGVGSNYQDHPLLVTSQTGISSARWNIFPTDTCPIVDISINTGNFSNATWNAEQRALYDAKREGICQNLLFPE